MWTHLRIVASLLTFLSASFSCPASFHVNDLTLNEKIGQLLMAHFKGTTANEEARTLIQDAKIGAIIYYNWANDLTHPSQVCLLSEGLQNMALKNPHPIPLFIAVDQEGGLVTRIKGLTQFPGNRAEGAAGDLKLTEQSALAMGLELRTIGINMNLAPVIDINCNPQNPVIGIRSYGSDPETVIAFGGRALQGFKQAEMITALKHFPGHGDVSIDSHYALPCIKKSLAELKNNELKPYAALAKNAEVIMTGHLLVPAFDHTHCSTLSKKTLDFLRKDLNYPGIIISDSLVMDAVLKQSRSIEEVAIKAFNAGCDLICLGGKDLIGTRDHVELSSQDVVKVHQALVNAVLTGKISLDRVNKSVERILELKNRYKLVKNYPNSLDLHKHQAISSKIATLAIKQSFPKGVPPINDIKNKKIAILAPKAVEENMRRTSLSTCNNTTSLTFYNENAPEEEVRQILKTVADADIVIFFAYNAWKSPQQTSLMTEAIKGKQSVVVILRDSQDVALAQDADIIFETFSPSAPSLQAIYEKLIAL